ncbi:MAG: thioredoxin family protein [Gemmatimonadota bacterium]|nr:MAG: thioredoxin family protein [Gemmatimonadota bacterium]
MQTMTRERFESGYTYDEFRKRAEKHLGLWDGVYEHLKVPEGAVLRLKGLPGKRLIAALAEDWCGDAASLVPIIAKLADAAPDKVELRVFKRDENLDIMDRYLSHGGRSIPVAIVFDEDMSQLGWWGPRPAPAQAVFREKIREFRAGRLTDKKEEVNKPVLRWYRKDRGRHTIDELLILLERGGALRV